MLRARGISKALLALLFAIVLHTASIAQAQDCNNNGIDDACDINCGAAAGACDLPGCGLSEDCNANGIPDECDTQTAFSAQQEISSAVGGVNSVFSADLDGDGDADVLSASDVDGKIAWYENIDGMGTFGPQQVITADADAANSVFAADLDGDGDADVLSASLFDDKIAWYENTDGLGSFGPQQVISTDADAAVSVFAADLDGDGDADVLSASIIDNKIAWYENTDGFGNFGPQQVITTTAIAAFSVFSADLDGDGDADVLSASRDDDKIAWYENTDGLGNFGTQQVITTATDSAYSVFSMDLDGDGDADVLSASLADDKIAWYENTDGLGNFGTQQVITTDAFGATSVCAADLDGDGDTDILSASFFDNKIAWYENTDGLGSFGRQRVITTAAVGPVAVFSADLDGDGDADVLSASFGDEKIAWYQNNDGLGHFGPQQVITAPADGATSVFAADLDGDGDADVLSASSNDNKIAWYDNIDGLGGFGTQQVITTDAVNARSVFAKDLDGDGDADVLSASRDDDKIAWYENADGLGNFSAQKVITTDAVDARSVFAKDLDGDGDADVLSALGNDGRITWYENTDGLGNFGPQRVITTAAASALSVFAADLDDDGDADVLSASLGDDKIAWYENTDGLGNFGPQQVITTDAFGATSVFAADLDRDGDADVLSATGNFGRITWYENTDGLGNFGPQRVITTDAFGATSVFAKDLDGDGDADVLSASFSDDKIAWYENTRDDCNGDGVPDECEPDMNGNGIPDDCEAPCGALQLGDLDGSGVVNMTDVSLFAAILLDPTTVMGDTFCAADVSQDGSVDGRDIMDFVDLALAP